MEAGIAVACHQYAIVMSRQDVAAPLKEIAQHMNPNCCSYTD